MMSEHTVQEEEPTRSRCMLNDWAGVCADCPDKDNDDMLCNQGD